MLIVYLIGILTNFVWTLVPFFQRKNRYIYFFLTLAIMGGYTNIQLLLKYVLNIKMPLLLIYTTGSFVALTGISKNFFERYIWIILSIALLLMVVSLNVETRVSQIIILIFLLMTLTILLLDVTKEALLTEKINIVWVIIVLYQLGNVLKYIPIIRQDEPGVVFYVLTNVIQIFFGLFLFFFKEDNPKMKLSL